jgi:hypothetical protein
MNGEFDGVEKNRQLGEETSNSQATIDIMKKRVVDCYKKLTMNRRLDRVKEDIPKLNPLYFIDRHRPSGTGFHKSSTK